MATSAPSLLRLGSTHLDRRLEEECHDFHKMDLQEEHDVEVCPVLRRARGTLVARKSVSNRKKPWKVRLFFMQDAHGSAFLLGSSHDEHGMAQPLGEINTARQKYTA